MRHRNTLPREALRAEHARIGHDDRAPDTARRVYVFVDGGNPKVVMNLQITGQYTSAVLTGMSDPAFAAACAEGRADFLPFIPNRRVHWLMSPFVVST
jgi:hypothetical protein